MTKQMTAADAVADEIDPSTAAADQTDGPVDPVDDPAGGAEANRP